MAKRKQAASEAVQVSPIEEAATSATATSTLVAEGGQGMDEPRATRFPDPREHKSISLGPERDSPRIRLLRSQPQPDADPLPTSSFPTPHANN